MGAGLILIPLAILIYMSFLIGTFIFYYKANRTYKKESEAITIPPTFKWGIIFIYTVAFLSNENFGRVISHALRYAINQQWHWLEYWTKRDIKRMLLGWDDFGDIIYYCSSIIIAYFIVYAIADFVEKNKKIRLYNYNKKKLAAFLLFVQPFIILSMIGRLLDWEPMVNEWLNL